MKVKAIVVGYGDRGSIYASYATKRPNELEITAVVDPDSFRLDLAKEIFGEEKTKYFSDLETLLQCEKLADCAILTTMDELHYDQAKALLEKGYHLLIEKPIVNNKEQLAELKEIASIRQRVMMVCHVLRYTPFYGAIKNELLSGRIGEIVHLETSELVGVCHSSCSFIRGKWKSKAECGSSMLLAKCCHDLDLICWLNNSTQPKKVASFGGRNFIVPQKAPKNSADKCYDDCPHLETCKFSAKALYIDNDMYPHYSYQSIKKKYGDITQEEKLESLKTTNPMGVCAYKAGADIVDHQAVMLEFENGSTAMHSMITAVPRWGRKIHIIGTEGEIEGFFESNVYRVRKFNFVDSTYTEEVIDVSKSVDDGVAHGGGDLGLVEDFVRRMQGEKASIAATDIQDSINGHHCVYFADESMECGEIKILPL